MYNKWDFFRRVILPIMLATVFTVIMLMLANSSDAQQVHQFGNPTNKEEARGMLTADSIMKAPNQKTLSTFFLNYGNFCVIHDTFFFYDGTVWRFLKGDNVAGGTVTSISAGWAMNFPTITTTGIINADSPTLKNFFFNRLDSNTKGNAITYDFYFNNMSMGGINVYFLSDSASTSVAGYKRMINPIILGAETYVTDGAPADGNLIQAWVTQLGIPNTTFIPAGNWTGHIHAYKTGGSKNVAVYARFYIRSAGGSETLIGTTSNSVLLTTTEADLLPMTINLGSQILLSTDRLVIKFYESITGTGSNPTSVTVGYGDNTAARLETPGQAVNVNNFVPYSGAINSVNISGHNLTADTSFSKTALSNIYPSPATGTVTNVIGGTNISITGTSTIQPTVNISGTIGMSNGGTGSTLTTSVNGTPINYGLNNTLSVGTGTVTNVIGGTNITITGTSTIQPTVNVSGTIAMANGGTGTTATTSVNTTPINYGVNNTITAVPSGSAGGDITGTYPNPTIKSSVALSGSPTTTTQAIDDNSTKIATTAYTELYIPPDTSIAASYSLTSRDAYRTIHSTASTGITLTVPTGLGTRFVVTIVQEAAGQVTFSASSTTLTFIPTSTTKTKQTGSIATIRSWATANSFTIQGDLQ